MKLKIKRKDIKKRVIKHFNMDYDIEYFENKTFDTFYKTLYSIVIKYYKDNEYKLSNDVLEECIIETLQDVIEEIKDDSDELYYGEFIKYLESLIVNKGYLYDKIDLFYIIQESTK